MPSIAERWAELSPEERRELIESIPPDELSKVLYDWDIWAREDQKLPGKLENGQDWFGWLNLSGRGSGKTRTGSETIKKWVGGKNDPPIRIALIAESAPDARDVMVEGDSGIMAVSPPDNRPIYQPSKRRLTWPNGTVAITFSGDKPDQLRGPQFHKAWVDELAKFAYPEDVMDNLEMGLRLGDKPQVIITTTPRPLRIIREMLNDPMYVLSRVSTYANISNLSPNYIKRVVKKYEGTRLGRQELNAELLMDTPGALWTYDMLEAARVQTHPILTRIVVAVDPSTSVTDDSNETGIVVVGKGADKRAYLLADASGVYTPLEWATKVFDLMDNWGASKIVAERNQGGLMVERTLRSVRPNAPIKLVWASQSKSGRAEPQAALYEQGKVKHVGSFARLEDQLVLFTTDEYTGPGSPDRADALVHALKYLMHESHASTNADDYSTFRA